MKPTELFQKNQYHTDKYDLGYLEHYYDLHLPSTVNRMMEIGADRGGSIQLWCDLYPTADIWAVDIRDFPEHRARKCLCDAYASADFAPEHSFDLIIDDGPHTLISMHRVLDLYQSKLVPGGRIIIEDIINSSWVPELEQHAADLYKTVKIHDMTGLQRTPKLLDRWQKGLFILTADS
jgi:trans-aconitate methyltransferase